MKRPWLLPLVPLYAAVVKLSDVLRRSPSYLEHPVISIGNLSTGGTGKTPFTIALAQLLKAKGFHVDVLSRGFGRDSTLTGRVEPNGDPVRFGDEPILIAREALVPVYVGASRLEAGKFAEREFRSLGDSIHLLDDGFQHRRLGRQIDIVLINSSDLADTLLPSGNLREPIAALRRATAFAIAADDDLAVETLLLRGFGPVLGQPIWRFRRELSIPAELAQTASAAFCGIARPEQFFASLRQLGVDLKAHHAFPDHHKFQPKDLAVLRDLATRSGTQALITTAKDAIRAAGFREQFEAIASLYVADLRIHFEDPSAIAAWIAERISRVHTTP